MIKVIQAYKTPETAKAQESDCDSIEDIYNIPFVQRWLDDPNFHKIYKSTLEGQDRHLLIVETNQGSKHWMIAYMEGDINKLPLPEWQQNK